jgi:hypothetical protein
MSEEFAKMAQQQQMIREALQKINREENKDGKGGLGNLNQMIEEMQSTETELVIQATGTGDHEPPERAADEILERRSGTTRAGSGLQKRKQSRKGPDALLSANAG